jgi:DNA-binding MarR family transcriptional regulator
MNTPDNNRADRLDQALNALKQAAVSAREHLHAGLTVTRTQLEILHHLSLQPEQTVSELAAKLYLTQSAVTQTVDTLVRRELVMRQASAEDRRVSRLSLTDGGEDVMASLRRQRRARVEALAAQLTDAEIDALISATGKMISFIKSNQTGGN